MTHSAVRSPDVCFVPSRFTGKERDQESGNDYFGARYYASSMGRFLSPDWSAKAEPVPYAKLAGGAGLNLGGPHLVFEMWVRRMQPRRKTQQKVETVS